MIKLKEILNTVLTENPDHVHSEIPGYRKYNLAFNAPDALPFAWVEDECIVGEYKKYHHQMPNLPTYVAASEEPRNVMDYPGRLWKDDKVISFWRCPKPKDMNKRIKELNDEMAQFAHTRGIKIDIKTWNLDVRILPEFGGQLQPKLIKIIDYIKQDFNSEFLNASWEIAGEYVHSKSYKSKK